LIRWLFWSVFYFSFIGLKEFIKLANPSFNHKLSPEYYIFGVLIYAIIGLSGLGYIDVRFSAIIFVIFLFKLLLSFSGKLIQIGKILLPI